MTAPNTHNTNNEERNVAILVVTLFLVLVGTLVAHGASLNAVARRNFAVNSTLAYLGMNPGYRTASTILDSPQGGTFTIPRTLPGKPCTVITTAPFTETPYGNLPATFTVTECNPEPVTVTAETVSTQIADQTSATINEFATAANATISTINAAQLVATANTPTNPPQTITIPVADANGDNQACTLTLHPANEHITITQCGTIPPQNFPLNLN